ncbi:MAG: serine kinase [Acidaminococcales bacterium]|jgi:predicted transcriptional regulator|nr:serine kinase [Acidaminococcales bacterium]
MKIGELIEKLGLEIKTDAGGLEREADNCYVSDLLSNVMGQASPGAVWITMQGHQNVAAVASLLSLGAVIVAGGAAVEEETLKKARENDITILATAAPVFEVAGRLYAEGLRGAARNV